MRLCLPFAAPGVGGGGYRFLHTFEAWLSQHDIPWHRSLVRRADVLFVNSWHVHPVKAFGWKLWHGSHGGIVQRLDGWPPDYGRTDGIEKRLRHLNTMAEVTIYQSYYAKRRLRGLGFKDGPVIYNPVDTAVFTPEGERHLMRHPEPMVAVMGWSTNPLKGMEHVWNLAGAHPDIRFVLIGRFERPMRTLRMVNIHEIGHVRDPKEIAAVLRSCDALVTFARNEACPNHVLEAMACGLPVLYRDSGATKELVGKAGLDTTEETFAYNVEHLLDHRELFPEWARRRALDFATDEIFPKYLEAMRCAS